MIDQKFWHGRRVLLTGHTGFKGSWLLIWLKQLGAEVWTYALEPATEPNLFTQIVPSLQHEKGWHHQIGDLANLNLLKSVVHTAKPEVVIHLAAQPLVRRSYIDPLGTWATNVMGSLHLLEALRPVENICGVVMVTTDKVYKNLEWVYGYRETDSLGGHDPYSASKAGAEIAISSWRSSYCGPDTHQNSNLRIATARAGNVIGGGDWAEDRIFPDAIRALVKGSPILVRNPSATRPWQHVIEPLSGYLRLAEALVLDKVPPCESFNFGPNIDNNRTVADLVNTILKHWPGDWNDYSNPTAFHEAHLLHLQTDKAYHRLNWQPQWNYETTIAKTVRWYRSVHNGIDPLVACHDDLDIYTQHSLTKS